MSQGRGRVKGVLPEPGGPGGTMWKTSFDFQNGQLVLQGWKGEARGGWKKQVKWSLELQRGEGIAKLMRGHLLGVGMRPEGTESPYPTVSPSPTRLSHPELQPPPDWTSFSLSAFPSSPFVFWEWLNASSPGTLQINVRSSLRLWEVYIFLHVSFNRLNN